jgi:hypothetical protein
MLLKVEYFFGRVVNRLKLNFSKFKRRVVIKCSMGYCIIFAVCVSNNVIFDADHF